MSLAGVGFRFGNLDLMPTCGISLGGSQEGLDTLRGVRRSRAPGSTKVNQRGMSQGALEPLRMYEQWTKSTNAYEHMVWYVTCMAYARASVRSIPGQVEIGMGGSAEGKDGNKGERETAMQIAYMHRSVLSGQSTGWQGLTS